MFYRYFIYFKYKGGQIVDLDIICYIVTTDDVSCTHTNCAHYNQPIETILEQLQIRQEHIRVRQISQQIYREQIQSGILTRTQHDSLCLRSEFFLRREHQLEIRLEQSQVRALIRQEPEDYHRRQLLQRLTHLQEELEQQHQRLEALQIRLEQL